MATTAPPAGKITTAMRSGPLSNRSFRLLATGQLASTIGDYCYAIALPWLVLSGHGGTVLLGTVLACYGIPRTILIPVGGILADRIGPRTLMLVADVTRCALVVVLTVLAARHITALAALGPTAAVIGAGEGLFLPSSFSIMPSLIDAEHLAAGNALSGAMVQVGSLAGPAIGGALVAATHASTAAFAVDAASFGVSALTLAFIPRRPASPSEPEVNEPEGRGPAWTEERGTSDEGRRDLEAPRRRMSLERGLLLIIIVSLAGNLASGGLGDVALPTLAHQHYGPGGFGLLLACLAAGSLIGTLAAGRTGGLSRPVVFCACVLFVMTMAMAAVPYAGGEAGAAAAMTVFGACNGLSNVTFITLVQRNTDQKLLGRLMGTIMLCSVGSFPLSVAVTGILVRHLGPAPFFPIAAATIAVPVLAALTQRDFRRYGASNPASLGESCGAGLRQVRGPLRVTVEMGAHQAPVRALGDDRGGLQSPA